MRYDSDTPSIALVAFEEKRDPKLVSFVPFHHLVPVLTQMRNSLNASAMFLYFLASRITS